MEQKSHSVETGHAPLVAWRTAAAAAAGNSQLAVNRRCRSKRHWLINDWILLNTFDKLIYTS